MTDFLEKYVVENMKNTPVDDSKLGKFDEIVDMIKLETAKLGKYLYTEFYIYIVPVLMTPHF